MDQIAAKKGLKDIMLLLLEHGADVQATCRLGSSVLHYAANCKWDYDKNISDDTYSDILELLLKRGAGIKQDFESEIQHSAFNVALVFGSERIIPLFIERGATIGPSSDPLKVSAIHLASINCNFKVLKFILDSGLYNVDHKNFHGMTALTLAAGADNVEGVKLLLERGADINVVSVNQMTPVYMAANRGHVKAFRVLLLYGADVNALITMPEEQFVERYIHDPDLVQIGLCLVSHLAKLDSQNRSASWRDYEMTRLKEYYKKCRDELDHMKKSSVDGSVTFFDILSASDIGVYARNEQIINTFETENIEDNFLIYHGFLTECFSKELDRQNLMKSAVKGMSRILKCDGETFRNISYNIFQFIKNDDLRNLIIVGN